MNNKFFAVSIDSLLKTFSAIDAGETVSFQIAPEEMPVISVNDCVLGFVGHGNDEFKMAFSVVGTDGATIELGKIIERADGVPAVNYAKVLINELAALSAPSTFVELPVAVGVEILSKLQGGAQSAKQYPHDARWQTITYGAPGTGKSFKIKGETAKKKVFRTTFHPDSDYATFVGAYKPVMKRDGVAFTEVSRKDTGSGQFSLVEKHDQRYGIGYQFVEQVFTQAYIQAWAYQKAAGATETPKPVYLIIEEINRGNCAQVFGDLFQLLDRKPNGFSDYAIKPDSDFGDYLAEKLGAAAGTFDANRRGVINNLYPEAEDGIDVVNEVFAGRLMLLPDNLYIRATMNTSDQSLFPMDSAFKRRWDWDYVAIQNHPNEDWKIEIDATTHYLWWEFLDAINQEIFKATSAEDKQLGYYFVRTADKKIDLDMFVNKVVFYLWNSVFKDCYTDCEFMKQEKDKYFTFTSFFKDGVINAAQAKAFLGKLKGLKSVEEQEAAKKAASANAAEATEEQPTAENA